MPFCPADNTTHHPHNLVRWKGKWQHLYRTQQKQQTKTCHQNHICFQYCQKEKKRVKSWGIWLKKMWRDILCLETANVGKQQVGDAKNATTARCTKFTGPTFMCNITMAACHIIKSGIKSMLFVVSQIILKVACRPKNTRNSAQKLPHRIRCLKPVSFPQMRQTETYHQWSEFTIMISTSTFNKTNLTTIILMLSTNQRWRTIFA